MNHTPTPWKVYKPLKGKYRGDFAIGTALEGNPLFCYLAQGQQEIQAANAAFIVRACNAYEALVTFAEAVSRSACLDQRKGDKCFCYSCVANATLKLATGE